jgi:uncharacterized protein YcfJ
MMKLGKVVLGGVMLSMSAVALAQDVHVVSVQPRWVSVQQQQCQQVQVRQDNSTVGTVIGGVAGGILGNQVGGGRGRDLATAAGAVTGAVVGNRIGQDQASTTMRQECTMVPVTMQKGEIVTFNYKGRLFTQTFE